MTGKVEAAVDLLGIDADAVMRNATAAVIEAEKAHMESLSDEALLAEAAKVEAELQKAMAALAAKKQATNACAVVPAVAGPSAFFEGTPIDCGAVAAVAMGAALDAMSDAALKAMIDDTEAQIASAKKAIEAKRSAPSGATKAAAPAAPSGSAAQRSAPPQTPTSRSREPPSSPFSPLVARASELLDDASAKSGVPKQTLAAAAVGAAVAAGVALVGIFGRRRR